jgi:hypothetical protein
MKYIIEQELPNGCERSVVFPDTYTQAVAESILDDNPNLDYRITPVPDIDLVDEVVNEMAPMSKPATSTPATVIAVRNLIREAILKYEERARARNQNRKP